VVLASLEFRHLTAPAPEIPTSGKIGQKWNTQLMGVGCNRSVAGRHVESSENYQLESKCVISGVHWQGRECP
jgi:hypothetical protein